MFPRTVTIFNVIKDKENITYHRNVVSDVFYHVNKIISQDGKGEKYTYAYDVIFSKKALTKWLNKQDFIGNKDTYTLRENDIIVLSEFKEINDIKELQTNNVNYFLIKTISENLYGDEALQNIEVTN